jgi:hypothetical protein
MRNPYDLAWDPDRNAIVVSDNGPEGGDELHVVAEGENCGWPHTWGNQPPHEGAVAPAYVFQSTVAPTGLHRLRGTNPMLRRGFLTAAFVTRGLYYFMPELAEAFPVVEGFDEFILDVTEGPNGEIYLATATGPASAIQVLHVPRRGDCNGDGLANTTDFISLSEEIGDGDRHEVIRAQEGAHVGSWGCDANADGVIDDDDLSELRRIVVPRRRSVRSR